MKKVYEAPRVVHTEKLEARATVCSKSDESNCGAGPIMT